MAYYTWDPKKILCTVSGLLIEGFAEGTFMEASLSEDSNTFSGGGAGGGSFNINPNISGTIQFTLQANSKSLNQLTALNLTKTPFPVLILNDNENGGKIVSTKAMVQKVPDMIGSKEISNIEVTISCADLRYLPI